MSYAQEAKEAYEARRTAIVASRVIIDGAEGREFSAEETASLETANTEIDRLDAVVTRALGDVEREERSAALDALIGTQSDAGEKDEESGLTPIEMEARQLWAPEGKAFEFGANGAERGRLARRDLTAGTATDGAELVPTTLFGQLYAELREGADSMFSLGRNIVTPSGEAIDMPKMTSFSTAVLVTEAAAISESDPQFGTVTLNAYKYGLAIQISHELEIDEAVPGALPFIVTQAVDGIRRGVGADLVTGTGTARPDGVDNGTNTSTVTGDGGTGDELIAAFHDIASPNRGNAVWLFNDVGVAAIRTLKTAGTTNYLWQPGLQASEPDRLLGKPVFTDEAIAVAGSSAKVGVFGDLKRGYIVRVVGSIRAERSTEFAFLNDLTTWKFVGRFDGAILDDTAYTVLVNAA